jgi:hypothetical protein
MVHQEYIRNGYMYNVYTSTVAYLRLSSCAFPWMALSSEKMGLEELAEGERGG